MCRRKLSLKMSNLESFTIFDPQFFINVSNCIAILSLIFLNFGRNSSLEPKMELIFVDSDWTGLGLEFGYALPDKTVVKTFPNAGKNHKISL